MARKRAFVPPVQRVGDGYVVNLGAAERELVSRLLDELSQLLMGESSDPRLHRIFPPAYHLAVDADADADYQRLMREELVASRLTAISAVRSALRESGPLDEQTMTSFVQSINGLRLVLGEMLDVSENADPDDIADDDPNAAEHHLYNFLSWLLDWAVQALSQSVTRPGA